MKRVTYYVDGFNFYYGLKRKKQRMPGQAGHDGPGSKGCPIKSGMTTKGRA